MKTSVQHTTVVKEASKLSGCLKAEAEKKDAGSILMPPRTLKVHPQLELLWLFLHGTFENAEDRERFGHSPVKNTHWSSTVKIGTI